MDNIKITCEQMTISKRHDLGRVCSSAPPPPPTHLIGPGGTDAAIVHRRQLLLPMVRLPGMATPMTQIEPQVRVWERVRSLTKVPAANVWKKEKIK